LRCYLLYVSSPNQLAAVKKALERMQARPIVGESSLTWGYEIKHRFLGELILQINILSDIDGVGAHLRQNPVDLLVYDERGPDAISAPEGIARIKKDVRSLAELWGPDFLFPMSRVVAILEREAAERAFELGRLHVREVCVAPASIATVLLWLKRILLNGVVRTQKVGMALSGGGIEGFLYQLGVLYALENAITNKSLTDKVDIISGVSSGAIAGTIFAAKVPVEEAIKAVHQRSKVLPSLTSKTIFDLAGFDIARRILKQSVVWAGLNPQNWLNKVMRSFPTGILKGQNLEDFFREYIKKAGYEDHFEDFEANLYIGATDQDSYEHVIFGQHPWDKIPVSEAMRASCALPPIFMPKMINGRWFIDGQVTKTTDLELVVEKGCSLVIIVNPLKPHPTSVPGATDKQGGIYGFIQTIKALISTRFEASLSHLTERYPDVDFIVFEPDEECAQIMSGSPMRYKIRTQIIQLGFLSTLRKLRERHNVYSVKLEKYGLTLHDVAALRKLESIDTARLGLEDGSDDGVAGSASQDAVV
jgi:NTE family protein